MKLSAKSALASLVVMSALAACATPAAAPGEPATLAEGATAPDGTVVKCRNIDVIGTRFKERTCKSEAAWATFDAMMAKDAKEETSKIQSVGSGAATNSGG